MVVVHDDDDELFKLYNQLIWSIQAKLSTLNKTNWVVLTLFKLKY
jgi:hypothetical protein